MFYNEDCLKVLPTLKDKSIDLVLTDLPYGTTPCKWDSVIPFDLMWLNLKRIIKKESAILLFGTEPFSSTLRASNLDWFKYDWIWEKSSGANFLAVKYTPMYVHEVISVFGNAPVNFTKKYKPMKYFPQMEQGKPYKIKNNPIIGATQRNEIKKVITNNKGFRYPRTVLKFKKDTSRLHPTQKPVALLEYFIKTYTKENDTVLDFTMGSGSTGVACKNLNRDFIGIELDKNYFKLAKNRINENYNSLYSKKATSLSSQQLR